VQIKNLDETFALLRQILSLLPDRVVVLSNTSDPQKQATEVEGLLRQLDKVSDNLGQCSRAALSRRGLG
jgi:hypothetical protein